MSSHFLTCLIILCLAWPYTAFAQTRQDTTPPGCHETERDDKAQCERKQTAQSKTTRSHATETDEPFEARVQWVIDGDTFQVAVDGRLQEIRLAQIDAPERAQPHGWAATLALIDQVRDRQVRVQPIRRDRYGRLIAKVTVDGRDVASELVSQGAAWCSVRRRERSPLCDLAREARAASRGLWALPEAERLPPWEWRRQRSAPAERK